jgi:hypothetical protein
MKLTIACLGMAMIIVFLGTLAQVHVGIFLAKKQYFECFFIHFQPEGKNISIPIFPGGFLVALILSVNFLCAAIFKFERRWRKLGLWLAHSGIALMIGGGLITALFSVESQMAIQEGQRLFYSEDFRKTELVIVDPSNPDFDSVISIPESLFSKEGIVKNIPPALPVSLRLKKYYPNSSLRLRGTNDQSPALVTEGVGLKVLVQEKPPVVRDDQRNQVTALVEVLDGTQSLGTWLLSNGLGASQSFEFQGKKYFFCIRAKRYYLPFSFTLKDFKHEWHKGTEIPKNFSSLIQLDHPGKQKTREVLISMNHPLRYEGQTFYQASFGKDDTLSVLQVVKNPGWTMPYISCFLVSIGLLLHFSQTFLEFLRKKNA